LTPEKVRLYAASSTTACATCATCAGAADDSGFFFAPAPAWAVPAELSALLDKLRSVGKVSYADNLADVVRRFPEDLPDAIKRARQMLVGNNPAR
jgi:hypothetical protein